jgi:hypothetical protein
MKAILVVFALLMGTSCSSFKSRTSKFIIKQVVKSVKPAAQEHLKCETGDAVADSLAEQIEKLLKVQKDLGKAVNMDGTPVTSDNEKAMTLVDRAPAQEDESEEGSKIKAELCIGLVQLSLPYLVDFGNRQLPDTWVEDGCTLAGVQTTTTNLAAALCNKL